LCDCSEIADTYWTICPYEPGVGQTGACTEYSGKFFGSQLGGPSDNISAGIISFDQSARGTYMLQIKGVDCAGNEVVSPMTGQQADYYYIEVVCEETFCSPEYCAENPCY